MSSFRFKTLQRVILPATAAGAPNVQGIIIAGGTELDGVPQYDVQFLDHLKRGAKGTAAAVARIVTILEPELIAAQPPQMVAEDAALALAKKSFDDGVAKTLAEIETLRQVRAAKRKRKPTGMTKPKSKRNR